MADKYAVLRDIRKNYGEMLSIQQVTKVLGYKDRQAAVKFLDGVSFCRIGKEKKYFALDIVNLIYSKLEDTG